MKEQKDVPNCHLFEAERGNFVYDVGSNELLAVEPELAAVLPLYGKHSENEIKHILKSDFLLSKIKEACATIKSAQIEEGLFLALQSLLVRPDPRLSEPGVCDTRLGHLVLSLTEKCNLRCRYCLHGADLDWVRDHGSGSMSLAASTRAVNYFLDRSDPDQPPVISFYGGEPLLEIGLIEDIVAVSRAHARGDDLRFAVDTNGVLLDDRAVDLILREKMHLQISLDGPREIHDRCRIDTGGAATFDLIMEGVDRLLVRDPAAARRLIFVTTLAPPVDLEAVAEFFADFPPYVRHGIKVQPEVTVNFANLRGQDWPAAGEPAPVQMERVQDEYLAAVRDGRRLRLSPVIRALFEPDLIRFHHRSRGPLGDRYTPGGNCRPGRRKLHVTVNGRLQPCERTGDLLNLGDLESGIRPEAVRGLQEGFFAEVNDRCGSCFALRMCGVCFAAQAESADHATGDFPVPEAMCEGVRRRLDRTLRMMAAILSMPSEAKAFLDDTIVA
ncbi:MAG: radical SAM protein [Candidatus Krumholzibacteriota bacterium]